MPFVGGRGEPVPIGLATDDEVKLLGTSEDVLGTVELVLGACEIPEPVGTIVWLQELCCQPSYRAVSLALQLWAIQALTTLPTSGAQSADGE